MSISAKNDELSVTENGDVWRRLESSKTVNAKCGIILATK